MGITVKNMPKDLYVATPDSGDVVVDTDGDVWLVTEDDDCVSLHDGRVVCLDDIVVAKIFSDSVLTLG